MTKLSGKQGGVAAVDRALSILDAFREGDDSLSLAELSARTNLYKSTILRLIESLERYQYVVRLPSGRYQLGFGLMRLGDLSKRSFKVHDQLVPVLEDLVVRTGESASFYVRQGDTRLCLLRVDSKRAIRDHVREGDTLPLDRGAAGRVLVFYGKGAGKDGALGHNHPITVSLGERDPELAAMAGPIFLADGQLLGALSLSGPLTRFTPAAVRSMEIDLLRACKGLTAH